LAAGVQYSECEDKVIGIEDLGNNNRRQKFGDKALRFMIRGLIDLCI